MPFSNICTHTGIQAYGIFRGKYYINGSHAGFLMYITDAAQNQEVENNIRHAMKAPKSQATSEIYLCTNLTGKRTASRSSHCQKSQRKMSFLTSRM